MRVKELFILTHGIVNLDKPVGMTSHDCVMKMRRVFQTKKVGHTGTLDPDVRGVLPICIGEATKIVPYLTDTVKTYRAEVTLGFSTTTEDQTGEKVDVKEVEETFTTSAIKDILTHFLGQSTQITPLYSAVKVNGKKLYEYARANIPVERPKRTIEVKQIALIPESIIFEQGLCRFKFEATVSKGTYIRTLCVDIGKEMGYPAHMSHLIRTQVADFKLDEATTFDDLEVLKEADQLDRVLYPLQKGVSHLPVYDVNDKLKERVKYGQKLQRPAGFLANRPYRMEHEGRLLAIYQTHPDDESIIKPLRGFNL